MSTNEHKTLKEALENPGVFKQTYDLKILEIGNIQTMTLKDGTQKTVQDLQVTDSTAVMKYTVWSPSPNPIYKVGSNMHLEEAYITEKNGYVSLRIAGPSKGGLCKFTLDSGIEFDYEAYKANKPVIAKATVRVGIPQNVKDAAKRIFNKMADLLSEENLNFLLDNYQTDVDLLNKELEL